MFVSITGHEDGEIGAHLIGVAREEFDDEELEAGGETIIAHEPMFGKREKDYDSGENVIAAIARTAGTDDESPGSALERLTKQIFLLGVAHGTKTERERIIARVAGE